MATPMMTVAHADGSTEQVKDTPTNRELVAKNGLKIEQGLIGDAIDFVRGVSEGGVATRAVQTVAEKVMGVDPEAKLASRLPSHSGMMTVVHDDGTREEIKDTEGNRKLAETHGLKLETSDETRARDIAALPEYSGARGAGNVFIGKAQSEFLMGIPEMARKSSMTEADKTAFDTIQAQHETAATAGTATGIAASLFVPIGGEAGVAAKAESIAGRAMAKLGIEAGGMASKIGIGAAKGAATGALYSAPHALAQAVFDDPTAAGESMAVGIGMGAAVGGLGPLAGKFIDYVKPIALGKAAAATEEAANLRTMKLLGLERGTMNKLGGADEAQAIGKVFEEAGIIKPGMKREAMLGAVEKLGEDSGTTIGSILKELDEHVAADTKTRREFIKAAFDTDPMTAYQRLEGATLPNGRTMKGWNDPGLAAESFKPSALVSAINDNLVSNKVGPFFESDMKMAKKAIEQVIATATGEAAPRFKGELSSQLAQLVQHAQGLEAVSLEKGQELKKLFQPNFSKNPLTLTDRDHLQRSIYSLVTDELNNAAERLATQAERPDLASQYDLAKRQYRAVMQTKQMRQNLVSKEDGNRFFSPSDHSIGHFGGMLGGAHAAEHGGSMLSGGLTGMLAGYAAKRIAESTPFQTTMVSGLNAGAKLMRTLAAQNFSEKIAALDSAIVRMGTRTAQAAMNRDRKAETQDVSPISAFIGGTETDPRKAYEAFESKIGPLLNNPDKMSAHLQSLASPIAEAGDPEAAMGMMQTQLRAYEHLFSNMPKSKLNAALFYNPEYRPTNAEIRDFSERVAAASDPFYLTRKIEDGTLGKAHIEAVKAVHPQTFGLIASRIKAMGYENAIAQKGTTLPYDARQRLTRLLAAAAPDMGSTVAPSIVPARAPQTPPKASGAPMKSIGNVASMNERIAMKK